MKRKSSVKQKTLKIKKKKIEINKISKKSKITEKKIEKKIEKETINLSLETLYNNVKLNDYNYSVKPFYIDKNRDKYNFSKEELDFLNTLSTITKFKLISPIEIIYKFKYDQYNKISLEPDKCSICQYVFYLDNEKENKTNSIQDSKNPYDVFLLKEYKDLANILPNVILLDKCSDHFFHIDCLKQLVSDKNNFKCPDCSKIYGILIGDQPKGYMSAYITKELDCRGYQNLGTIVIDYYFPSGSNYSGTTRECYLPNCQEGKEILGLLKIAFDRKLIFTVGTSVTTGEKNTTVWNGIHHKTNLSGGPVYYGYPDPTYFNRVKEELAAKGVNKENIDEDLQKIADDLINTS